jgi:hypothetical protein
MDLSFAARGGCETLASRAIVVPTASYAVGFEFDRLVTPLRTGTLRRSPFYVVGVVNRSA